MSFEAMVCPNDHVTYPTHTRCPECGEAATGTVDLSDRTGTVITWTTSTSAPPGVREPNTLAIVEFDVDRAAVRAIGGVTTDDIEIGETVEPVYVEELRDPTAGIKDPESQSWDGYRFRPV